MNKKIDFILCLFLGYLGVHKFYEKKIGIGILYIFTAGLFFIGWIYDCVKLGTKLYKSQNITQSTIKNKQSNSALDEDINNPIEASDKIYEKKNIHFENIINNYKLKWNYSDVTIKGVQYRDIDFSKLEIGKTIDLLPEPDNKYDEKAIKIIQSDMFLGYIPKGDLQEMILKYSEDDNYLILAKLCLIDEENQLLQIHLVFYKEIIESDFDFVKKMSASLIKTTKKDSNFDISRQDALSKTEENEYVSIEKQYDSDCYLVLNECGEEIGELSQSISDKLDDYDYTYDKLARIVEITENSSGNYGAKLEIIILK